MANELILDRARKRLVSDLVTRTSATIPDQFEGDTNVVFDVYGDADWSPKSLTLAVGIPDSNGEDLPVGGVWHLSNEVNSEQDSGTLIVGQWYKIDSAVGGSDDFTNVGASSNAYGVIFQATGETPSVWASSTSLVTVTPPLAPDISAADLEAALNGSRLGGDHNMTFSVSGSPGAWVITCLRMEAFQLVAITDSLFPDSTAVFRPAGIVGSVTEKAVFQLLLRRDLVAETNTNSTISAGAVTVDEVVEGSTTVSAVWDITLDGMPYGGTVAITVADSGNVASSTISIPFNADEPSIVASLESLGTVGTGNVQAEVLESGPIRFRWRLTFSNLLENVTVTADDSAIIYGHGERFELSFDTTGMHEAMAGRDSRILQMELQDIDTAPNPDTITTLFRAPITINNDLIP